MPKVALLNREFLEMDDHEFKAAYNLSKDDYRLLIDSSEIEAYIRRILYGVEHSSSLNFLKEINLELENESSAFKKHKKMIDAKRKQIDQLKEVLPVLQEQIHATEELLNTRKQNETETLERRDCTEEIEFLKKLMNYKLESRKNYYGYKQAELEEDIEWYQKETRLQEHANIQTISFWLLKYDAYSQNLDSMLKKMFDAWSEIRRKLRILKKYRKLNLKRIEKLHKLIAARERYIEKHRQEKEKEQKKREAELRRENAATKIQAFWRGTMVRKHLGPYKVKKSKKGKDKKGKGKKKK